MVSIFDQLAMNTRKFTDSKGGCWFCFEDLINELELYDVPKEMLRELYQEGIAIVKGPSQYGKEDLFFVDEGNLYDLAFASESKKAHAVQDWVYGEVLPSIFTTGEYTGSFDEFHRKHEAKKMAEGWW